MNQIIVVGTLKDDAKIEGNCLTCTVIVRKPGYGQNAGKVFSDYFNVKSYGRDNQQVVGTLRKDCLVSASGEARAEAYQGKRDQKWYGAVVINGMNAVRLIDVQSEQSGQPAPAPTASAPRPSAAAPATEAEAPAEDPDEIPF